MLRLCGRPGCSEPGTVAYGMIPEDLLFWVAALERDDHEAAVLCRRHADAIVVPRGWTLDDRREPTLRLFRPPAAADDTGAVTRRRRRDHTPPGGIPMQLDLAGDEVDDETAPAPPDDAGRGAEERGPAGEWRPEFDVDDDLDGLLQVDSPLLARAFRGAGRPRT